MTGDELAIALHAEQGFLILVGNEGYPVGKILRSWKCGGMPCTIPLVVKALAPRKELAAQCAVQRRLTGLVVTNRVIPGTSAYRVEAAD